MRLFETNHDRLIIENVLARGDPAIAGPPAKLDTGRVRPAGGRGHVRALRIISYAASSNHHAAVGRIDR